MSQEGDMFTPDDLRVLSERGVSAEEARRQLECMAHPPLFAQLERPCTIGDGMRVLSAADVDRLLATHAAAAAAGRVSAFVPASGAATRMFKDLLAALALPGELSPAQVQAAGASGDASARALLAWIDGLPRFAFADDLAAALRAQGFDMGALRTSGPWRPLLEAFLGKPGLDYASAPKALLAFHREQGSVRTALEEQLLEAGALAADARGECRLHFTVSPEHRAGFTARLAAATPVAGLTWSVSFSEQHPATDTLAADPAGGPFRDADGRLLFRPAGHGALIRNLEELGADLVFLKNIDNVAASRLRAETSRWSRALVGLAAALSAEAAAHANALEQNGDAAVPAARAFLLEQLGEPVAPATRAELLALLERPLRVAGMVRNTGEPGGGPFWVRGADGRVTRQVVESAQVDPGSAEQVAILRAATHFNPVFIACALRDRHGRAYALEPFVDPDAVIVTRKSAAGRELLALERPGLWNGAMARWNTVFVEVPLAVFNPVKTVLDLLRPEHQG